MNRFVVVDLETTGHSVKKGDEIIEVGLVVIENNEIVQEYSSKIKPDQPIPPFITRLTGITDKDLEHAPRFQDIIPELMTYLKDAYFVAHQVQFDFNFLNESFIQHGYKPLQLPVIDTVEMSRVLFPKANSFKLEDITKYLNINHYSPHRALSDAYVTGLLLIKLLNKLEELPFETLSQLQPLSRFFNGDLEQIIEEMIQFKRYKRSSKDLVFENGFAVKKINQIPSQMASNKQHSLTFEEFLNQFDEFEQFSLRESQVEVAKQIVNSFKENRHAVIEAETGIGKTLSYLLAAIYFAQTEQSKTLISTSTIQLQHQVINQDWTLLLTLLKQQQYISVLKSPSHYINLTKLRYYLEEFDDYNYDSALSLCIILVWLTDTLTGDKDEIQLPSKGEEIWAFISGENSFNDDQRGSYFQLALERANASSVVVVNHAFLVADHLYETNRLNGYQYLVVDEAHRLHEVVQKQLGSYLDYVSIAHVLNNVGKLTEHVAVERLKHSADQFFRSIHQAVLFLHSDKDSLSDTGKIQLPLDQYHLDIILSGHLKQQLNEMLTDLKQLSSILKQNHYNNSWKTLTKQIALEELKTVNDVLIDFFNTDDSKAKWIDIDQDGAKNSVQLNVEPIHVQDFIQANIVNKNTPTILLSATLKTNHSFKSFLDDMGLNEDTECMYLPSPYNFQQQVRMYVPNDFPHIKESTSEEFDEAVARFALNLINELGDKAVVLFTSYEMLKSVYKMIKVLDRHQETPVLAQGVQTGSREKLKKLFEKSDQALLLGTSSFWEGIDIYNESLKIVVMVRLPFDTPNHPMFQAKTKHLEESHKNAFYHWMLPQAVLRFRQAFGRLIRHEHDQGLFIVLDRRIMTKPYGKQFLKSIPEVPLLHDTTDGIVTDAKNWLSYKWQNDKN